MSKSALSVMTNSLACDCKRKAFLVLGSPSLSIYSGPKLVTSPASCSIIFTLDPSSSLKNSMAGYRPCFPSLILILTLLLSNFENMLFSTAEPILFAAVKKSNFYTEFSKTIGNIQLRFLL